MSGEWSPGTGRAYLPIAHYSDDVVRQRFVESVREALVNAAAKGDYEPVEGERQAWTFGHPHRENVGEFVNTAADHPDCTVAVLALTLHFKPKEPE